MSESRLGRPVAAALALSLALLGLGLVALVPGLRAQGTSLSSQSQEDADRKSAGCVSCHTGTDAKTMHKAESVRLGCTDCHGGDAGVNASGAAGSGAYREAQGRAHVRPK